MIKLRTLTHTLPVIWSLALLLLSPASRAAEANPGEHSATITRLLWSANQALRENRLTVPSGDNAVMYAQRVLDLSPGHSAAQEILRAVVARYGIIAGMALDRAETLKAQEIAKARTYGERGKRVAQRYRFSDLELRQVKERIAALEADPEKFKLSAPELLLRVAERYRNKSATALVAGHIKEARLNHNIAAALAQDYRLPSPGLTALGQQIAEAEQRAVSAAQTAALRTKAPAKGLASREILAPFLPPAF